MLSFITTELEIDSLCSDDLQLCRFMSFSENSVEALSGPYLWFSLIRSFNDPFEAERKYRFVRNLDKVISAEKYSFGSGWPLDEAEQELRKEHKADSKAFFLRLETKFREHFIQVASKEPYAYCCLFSQTVNKRPDSRQMALMWSHYGDGLRGVRVNYDSRILLSTLSEDVRAAFMSYMNKPPVIDLVDEYSKVTGVKGPRYSEDIFLESPSVKSTAWKYEREFRIISRRPGPVYFDPKAIASVDIGERMKDSQKRVVQLLMKQLNPNALINIARVRPGTFDIEYIPI